MVCSVGSSIYIIYRIHIFAGQLPENCRPLTGAVGAGNQTQSRTANNNLIGNVISMNLTIQVKRSPAGGCPISKQRLLNSFCPQWFIIKSSPPPSPATGELAQRSPVRSGLTLGRIERPSRQTPAQITP